MDLAVRCSRKAVKLTHSLTHSLLVTYVSIHTLPLVWGSGWYEVRMAERIDLYWSKVCHFIEIYKCRPITSFYNDINCCWFVHTFFFCKMELIIDLLRLKIRILQTSWEHIWYTFQIMFKWWYQRSSKFCDNDNTNFVSEETILCLRFVNQLYN